MGMLEPGDRVNDTLTVDRSLGEGAYAEVYRVRHEFLGLQAMQRRVPDYNPAFEYWNHIASVWGYSIMAAGMGFFFLGIIWSRIAGKKCADNPWGEGATTLEWTLSSPPPYHQFETLPKVD